MSHPELEVSPEFDCSGCGGCCTEGIVMTLGADDVAYFNAVGTGLDQHISDQDIAQAALDNENFRSFLSLHPDANYQEYVTAPNPEDIPEETLWGVRRLLFESMGRNAWLQGDTAAAQSLSLLTNLAKTRKQEFLLTSHCASLDIATRACTDYENRPPVCREFNVGSAGCLEIREETTLLEANGLL